MPRLSLPNIGPLTMARRIRGQSWIGTRTWAGPHGIRLRIIRRDKHTCQLCERTLPASDLEVDHIQPRHLAGTDHPSNLRTLCKPCHYALKKPGGQAVRPTGPVSWEGVRVHDHGRTIPTIRGDSRAGDWTGPGCPPECAKERTPFRGVT